MADVEEALTSQLASIQLSNPTQPIIIDNVNLPSFDLVSLLIDEKRDVVLLGDDNFTLSVALAALRQSWNRIRVGMLQGMATHHINTTAKFTCIDYCIKNGEKLKIDDATEINNIKQILHLPPIPPTSCIHVDLPSVSPASINIPEEVSFQNEIVWYQMPWVIRRGYGGGQTYPLIELFLNVVSPKQKVGDYLLIGVTRQFPYVKAYDVPRLHSFTNGYHLIGAAMNPIEKLLQYGYMKEGPNDLHNTVLQCHATLVFERKDSKANYNGTAGQQFYFHSNSYW